MKSMRKTILNIILVISTLLVTFFGMGPVLMADGSIQERLLTLFIIIGIYIILVIGYYFVNRRVKR